MPITRLGLNQVPGMFSGDGNIFYRPNPLQQEIEQAKLAQLRQEPYLEASRLQLEREDRARMLEALRTQSAQEQARLGEEERFHTASLAEERRSREETAGLERGRLAEERAYHGGELGLGERKLSTETEQAERDRKLKAMDALGYHVLQSEIYGGAPKGLTAEFMKRMGRPEFQEALDTLTERDLREEVRKMGPQTPVQIEELRKSRPELARFLSAEPTATAPAASQGSEYPGINLGGAIKYAPIDLQNILTRLYNVGGLPIANTLNSIFGLPAMRREQLLPRDYGAAYKQIQGEQ